MAILKLMSMLAFALSVFADAGPEDAILIFAASPISADDGRHFPCEDMFASSVLNALRRSAVSQLKKTIDAKKISQIDGLILMKTLNENLALLDSRLLNITSEYHAECASCSGSLLCCLQNRAIWARHASEVYSSTIDELCSKASTFKLAEADCAAPLSQLNISNDIADLLRCEAQCKYVAYLKEPICASKYM